MSKASSASAPASALPWRSARAAQCQEAARAGGELGRASARTPPQHANAQPQSSVLTIKLPLKDIARSDGSGGHGDHLAYWSARAVEMDRIDRCMIDVGAAYAAEEYEAGRPLPEIWTEGYWRSVGAAVAESRLSAGAREDAKLVAEIRAFALTNPTFIAHGGQPI
jgi:hypothetical protein